MNKYVCDACYHTDHLNCTSVRQGRIIAKENISTDKNLPVCICACFGEFIKKELRSKKTEVDEDWKFTLPARLAETYSNREFRLKGSRK